MRHHIAPVLAVMLALAHLAWIPQSLEPVFPDFDAVGYLTAGHAVANYGETTIPSASPLQFAGIHWYPTDTGSFVIVYPPGLPLLLAALLRLGGTPAALAANPVLLSVALLLLFFLCRPHVGDGLALLATALLAVNPLANGQAFHVDSHTAAMACVLAVALLLDRWERHPQLALAAGVGLLLGVLPAIRYAEAVCGLSVLTVFALRIRRSPDLRSHALAMTTAAALPIAALLYRNHLLFGSWGRTGYELVGLKRTFSFRFAALNLGPYLLDLWQVALLVLPLGAIGTVLLLRRGESRRTGIQIAVTVTSLIAVYSAFIWHLTVADSSALRYLLPVIPLLLFSGMVAVEALRSARPILGLTLIVSLLVQVGLQSVHTQQRLTSAERWSAPGLKVAHWVEEKVPPGSIVIASFPIATNLQATGRWRLADGDFLGDVCGTNTRARFTRGLTEQVVKVTGAARRYDGLDCQSRRRQALTDLSAWSGVGGSVYFVALPGKRDAPGEWREVDSAQVLLPLDLWRTLIPTGQLELSLLQLVPRQR